MEAPGISAPHQGDSDIEDYSSEVSFSDFPLLLRDFDTVLARRAAAQAEADLLSDPETSSDLPETFSDRSEVESDDYGITSDDDSDMDQSTPPAAQQPDAGAVILGRDRRVQVRSNVPNATPLALLAHECNQRRFTPRYTEWMVNNGKFKCSVNIQGQTFCPPRSYRTRVQAKEAAALLALPEVRTLAVRRGPAASASTSATMSGQGEHGTALDAIDTLLAQLGSQQHPGPHPAPRAPENPLGGAARPQGFQGNRRARTDPAAQHPGYGNNGRTGEQQALINRILSLYGNVNGPSRRIMEDSLASRAFLEGMAMGVRLSEQPQRRPEVARSLASRVSFVRQRTDPGSRRSRSPAQAPNVRRIRERSPLARRVSRNI